jgi:hypothetical protein
VIDEFDGIPAGLDQKPQSPQEFLLRYRLNPNRTLVLLFIVIEARFSPLLALIVPLHSPPLLPEEVTAVGDGKTGEFKTGFVGNGGIVGAGWGVSVGVAAGGGIGVSVGIAA